MDLPWSMWAMMEKLRMRLLSVNDPGIPALEPSILHVPRGCYNPAENHISSLRRRTEAGGAAAKSHREGRRSRTATAADGISRGETD